MLSYLPMCYTLERCCQLVMVLGGGGIFISKSLQLHLTFDSGRIGFYCGSMRCINVDMRDLRPTILPSVPRMLNRLYNENTNSAARNVIGR